MSPPENSEGRAPRKDAATITEISPHHKADGVDPTRELAQEHHADLGLIELGATVGDDL